jgi:hypothetical protein
MNPFHDYVRYETRRQFFARGMNAVGWAALASLLGEDRSRGPANTVTPPARNHFPGKAKQVIWMHMVGGPPQQDLFDYRPQMEAWFDKDLPDSIRMGQRLTTMTSGQARFPIAPSKFKFQRHGKCGMWVCELLPWTAKVVDDMCFIRSMHTEAINHEPAITYMQTGNQVTGRPCMGAWVSYGLGSLNQSLRPVVVVRLSVGRARRCLFSLQRGPNPLHQQSARGTDPGPPPDTGRFAGSQRDELPDRRRPGDAHAHPAIRDGLSHAGECAGADRHHRRARIHVPAVWRTSQETGYVRQHRVASAASHRTRRTFHPGLSQQLGHPRQRRWPASRPVPGYRFRRPMD